jgi:hypothetical protein
MADREQRQPDGAERGTRARRLGEQRAQGDRRRDGDGRERER